MLDPIDAVTYEWTHTATLADPTMTSAQKIQHRPAKPSESTSDIKFCNLFRQEMERLYLLAFLLTANPETAEHCFISSLEECMEGIAVNEEWAHSWAKRVVIKNAIRLVAPRVHHSGSKVLPRFRQKECEPPERSPDGKRWAALFANGRTSDILSRAVFPSVFHQDPRYFYQGSGSTWSRTKHAIGYAFVARSDSGHLMPNYSYFLGNLSSGASSNLYYPGSSRGAGLAFENAAIGFAGRINQDLAHEFLFKHLTKHVSGKGKPSNDTGKP